MRLKLIIELHIMGTLGVLLVAYKENLLSKENVLKCIETLKATRRHISDKLYKQLIENLSN